MASPAGGIAPPIRTSNGHESASARGNGSLNGWAREGGGGEEVAFTGTGARDFCTVVGRGENERLKKRSYRRHGGTLLLRLLTVRGSPGN